MIGNTIAKCLTCLQEYTTGDCITHECPDCQCRRLGHLRVGNMCGRCMKHLPRESVGRCDNCGKSFEYHGPEPLHCPGCEDWFRWKEEEEEKNQSKNKQPPLPEIVAKDLEDAIAWWSRTSEEIHFGVWQEIQKYATVLDEVEQEFGKEHRDKIATLAKFAELGFRMVAVKAKEKQP